DVLHGECFVIGLCERTTGPRLQQARQGSRGAGCWRLGCLIDLGLFRTPPSIGRVITTVFGGRSLKRPATDCVSLAVIHPGPSGLGLVPTHKVETRHGIS